jgi:gamma-glutamyl hercynylcysteine S-oxide synthase
MPGSDAAEALTALEHARRETLALVAHLDDSELERTHSPIMSPLVWDLAHIAAYEDLWLAHRHAGLELLRPDLAELYDAFETPRSKRGEIELLSAPAARAYMREVRERVATTTASRGVGDGILHELVLRHELQHTETMRQTLDIAGLLPPEDRSKIDQPLPTQASQDGPAGAHAGHSGQLGEDGGIGAEEWLEIPAGSFTMGAGPEGFSYDNERPRHAAQTAAFRIARRPVTNASWLHFSEGGGYERREWWSQEGWAWKQDHDITQHPAVAAGHPQAPVCHVSWFEADAFARAHGARLPTEAEWERTARDRQGLVGVGRVWEWTSSHFRGYPGFIAHPYKEYSEVFFGDDYLVLRGGSWATSPRVRSATFRNWDHPQRRQIFAGLRLTKEA